MEEIEIEDRVAWLSDPELVGTVKGIYLSDHPFYVVWDDGRDDWYRGSNLRKIVRE